MEPEAVCSAFSSDYRAITGRVSTLPAHIQPLFIKRLQELGYEIQTYPSATFADPPFGRVIFGGVPGIHTETKGNTPLERDTRIAEEFISDSQQHKKSRKPFFSFLFFGPAS